MNRLPVPEAGPGTARAAIAAIARTAVAAITGALAASWVLTACGTARPPTGPSGHAAESARSSSSAPATPTSRAPSSPGAAGAGSAAGFAVVSMTFISDTAGFALGTVPCGTRRCVALLRTVNGGKSWLRLAAPTKGAAASYGTCPAGLPCIGQIRFATPLIGYAFDPSLLITTDGGHHWRLLADEGVSSLEAAGGTVIRVASRTQGCAGTPSGVESAPVGTAGWHVLHAPPIYLICPPVLYRQGSRLVLAGYGNPAGGVRATARIDRSADGSRTWLAGNDSCGGKDGYASAVALAPPDVLAELCQHQMPDSAGQYAPAWIRVSVDGGATFAADRLIPTLPGVPRGVVIRYQLAAASPARLLVMETGEHGSQVLLSENGGQTWSTPLEVPGSAAAILIGYEDPSTARIAQANTVWTTTTGGRTWHADHFIGS